MDIYVAALQAYSPLMLFTFTAMFGLIIGSFLNVIIYRLPIMLKRSWQQEAKLILDKEPEDQPAFNLATPASTCPTCGHKIRYRENIPIISWLFLKGRCAECGVKISSRYPLIELTTAVLTCLVIYEYGVSFQGLSACLLTWVLISLSLIDYDHQILPDNLTLPFLWLGLVINFFGGFVSLENALWGAISGYLVLWSIYWAFKLITGKEGMGYGDFKLLAMLGAWMGWQQLPIIIVLSSFSGAIIGGILIMLGRDKTHPIPFGPYLAIAGWLTLLWGDYLYSLYWQLVT